RGGLLRSLGEVVDRELVGLGLHQPVGHRLVSCGVRPGRTLEPRGSRRSLTGHRKVRPTWDAHKGALGGRPWLPAYRLKDVSLDEHRRKPPRTTAPGRQRAPTPRFPASRRFYDESLHRQLNPSL